MSASPRRRRWEAALFRHLGAPLAGWLLRLLALTIRFRIMDKEVFATLQRDPGPQVVAFWHEDLCSIALLYLRLNQNKQAGVMVSESRDGEMLSLVIRRLALKPIRGSSSRGGVRGIIEFKRWLELESPGGRLAVMALDGPRGPRRVAKPGAALLARRVQGLIVPVALHASSQWVFRSWDRTRLPKPFAVIEVRLGTPLDASAWTAEDDQPRSAELQRILNTLHEGGDVPGGNA